ncbi:AAA family ATPase, partial [Mycobacterium asiaticum]|uniref:nucleotide-binding protein n=1 Tax=Mycobacterium asiaticum TaxID=1790 RepID=UPI003F5B8A4A
PGTPPQAPPNGGRGKRRAPSGPIPVPPPSASTPATPAPPTRSPAPPPPATAPPPAPMRPPPPDAAQAPEPAPPPATPKPKKARRPVPQRGWRRGIYKLTRINFGLSRDEKHELELRNRVARKPRGSYQIGMLGLKGGVGKTTTTVTLGTMLAQVRGDRILVLDADPGCGNL